jgi:hypothetical protein
VRTIRNLAFVGMIGLGIVAGRTEVAASWWCQYDSCSSLSLLCDAYCAPTPQAYEYSSCEAVDDGYGGTWNCYQCWCGPI